MCQTYRRRRDFHDSDVAILELSSQVHSPEMYKGFCTVVYLRQLDVRMTHRRTNDQMRTGLIMENCAVVTRQCDCMVAEHRCEAVLTGL